ncbi:Esa1p-associated factor [Coemansia sp. RSA 2607]|nr:Esa1p-associated factor [Coemansia sp. RSA 2607]
MSGKSNALTFKANERILCFHGPLLYEAKVMKAEMWDGSDPEAPDPGPHYFVHYKGWKQTWDEWVDESRALKFNEENLAKQKALRLAALQASKKKTIVLATKHASKADSESESQQHQQQPPLSSRSRKRIRESSVEKTQEREEVARVSDVKMPIPNALKSQLVDDWERITKDRLLVPLPRKPTVAELLTDYQEFRQSTKDKRKAGKRDEEVVDEIIDGLRVYFDKALGNILLYRFERYQYKMICERYPGKPPSEIYGAEHLLRLFVQMPGLIAHTNMDEEAVQLLREHMADILKYMHRLSKTLFVEEYETASPAYMTLAKGI